MAVHGGIPRLSPQPQVSSVHCTQQEMIIPKHFLVTLVRHWTCKTQRSLTMELDVNSTGEQKYFQLSNLSYRYHETVNTTLFCALERKRNLQTYLFVSPKAWLHLIYSTVCKDCLKQLKGTKPIVSASDL